MKKRILTGDRPTGQLHIGHYFGALQNRVLMQDAYETFVIIADVQALTDNFNTPQKVKENVYQVAIDNLSVGIDPEKTVIFIQSMIPEIAELTVFYSNLVTVARLQRNPTVKTEILQKDNLFGNGVTYGFLGYPVSQAADITAFQADMVPVGEDQLPQIEQTKEIVRRFNRTYGITLKEPEYQIGSFGRVKGLDGNAKMGKSLNNAIYLADTPEIIEKKVMSALTDCNKVYLKSEGNPDACTVSSYHEMFSKDSLEEIRSECESGGRGCKHCKNQLAEKIKNHLAPIQEKRLYYQERPELVKDILMTGTAKAKIVAAETLRLVKERLCLDFF